MAEAGVVRGVVALELAGGQPPARDALGPEPGGELATRVGRDLARLVDCGKITREAALRCSTDKKDLEQYF